MAELAELENALFKADRAGDTASARLLSAEIVKMRAAGDTAKWQQQIRGDVAGSGPQRFNAGVGKAFADLGRGAAQVVGLGPSPQETQESRALDAPLMSTGAGTTGNIAGTVAALAPLARVPGVNSVVGAGGMGALMGGAQPAISPQERAINMVTGGVLGSGLQKFGSQPVETLEALKSVATAPFKAIQASVEPFYGSGREQILARTMREATGPQSQQALQRLQGGRELVPGSAPTAAEVANSGGLAALQRAASATNPEAYATRALQQNEARLQALKGMAGSGGKREAMTAIRDQGADEMYAAARAKGLNPEAAQVLRPQIKNLMERVPSGVVERAKELARINGEAFDSKGSMNGLHWMKVAVDDLLSSAPQTGIGTQTTRAINQFKGDLLSVMDELSPAYGQARQSFAEMSRIPNQMETAQELLRRSVRPIDNSIQPGAYARALADQTLPQSATGFKGSTFANTLEPQQLQTINAIKEDLARSLSARDLGRGAGSDTAQKLAMSNLMQRAGVPQGILNAPVLGRMGNFIYKDADERMRQQLAQTLLNPRETARIMALSPELKSIQELPAAQRERLAAILRSATPAGISMERN